MATTAFHTFGLSHATAVLATAALAVWLIRLNRSRQASPRLKQRVNNTMAVALIISVAMDPLLTWMRHRSNPEEALLLLRRDALPIHLCDVVSIVLAAALLFRHQRSAELGYLWGMAGTLQGLITPTLQYDWHAPEYYAFFIQHGGVPASALALAFGCGLPPQKGALWRAMKWSWVYMAGASLLNYLLSTNYGYFNAPPDVPSLLDAMGPWPWYLLTLQAVGLLFFSILLLPWRKHFHSGT